MVSSSGRSGFVPRCDDLWRAPVQAKLALTDWGRSNIENDPQGRARRRLGVKAGFCAQRRKTYGPEAWAAIEKHTGKLFAPDCSARPNLAPA
jgi:hypothetical protein